jgi:hypothetical protein
MAQSLRCGGFGVGNVGADGAPAPRGSTRLTIWEHRDQNVSATSRDELSAMVVCLHSVFEDAICAIKTWRLCDAGGSDSLLLQPRPTLRLHAREDQAAAYLYAAPSCEKHDTMMSRRPGEAIGVLRVGCSRAGNAPTI